MDPVAHQAVAHLRSVDPVLASVIADVGPYEPVRRAPSFESLVRAIVGQQISIHAASAINGRLLAFAEDGRLTPKGVLSFGPGSLRQAGLSAAKVRYVLDLAERVDSNELEPESLVHLSDEAVIEKLVAVKGIGRWTAEMFLIFALGRLDVLPVDDLGFRKAVRRQYALAALSTKDQIEALGETWRPYRSVATWYLWQSLRIVPSA